MSVRPEAGVTFLFMFMPQPVQGRFLSVKLLVLWSANTACEETVLGGHCEGERSKERVQTAWVTCTAEDTTISASGGRDAPKHTSPPHNGADPQSSGWEGLSLQPLLRLIKKREP